jgi:hypothetical protein
MNDDNMLNAVMDVYRSMRADDRINQLRAGSKERGEVINEHLTLIAKEWGVDSRDLALELARAIDR